MKKLLSFLCLFLCCSCSSSSDHPPKPSEHKENATTVFTGNAMTINFRIIIDKDLPPEEKTAVEKKIQQIFKHVDLTYNKWNPHSEISRLNRMKAGMPASISSELERFFNQVDAIVILTEGRFDPTIEPLQQLWKDKLEKGSVPTENEIESIIPAVGWKNIHYSQQVFTKDHDLTSLDLGGIAKGLCVDLLVENLNRAGYENIFVEWGGEIRASGNHPDNRPWNIYISSLGDADPKNAIAYVPLRDEAIATSGDYLQNWTVHSPGVGCQSTSYCHIIDPWTFMPLKIEKNTIASASVLAPSCVLADGLATAAMMFPSVADAKEWSELIKEKSPHLSFWFVVRE